MADLTLDDLDLRLQRLEQKKLTNADLPWGPMQARLQDDLFGLGGISTELLAAPETAKVVGAPGAAALENSWLQYGGVWNAHYYKHDGIVYVRGLLSQGVGANEPLRAFLLPTGYRPDFNQMVTSWSFWDTGGYIPVRADVTVDGAVNPLVYIGGTKSGNCQWTHLNFTFRASTI